MINLKTLLSAFDEKVTLLKWLKKVETALANATLENVQVVVVDETHIKMKFVFADGTSVESPSITLPRGLQGDKGDTGAAGEAATIEVGTVTTGEPGSNVSVTNVGTVQRAIFDFVIPRGDKGEPGESGTQWYMHDVLMRTAADTTEKLLLIDTSSFEIESLQDLYRLISGIGPVRYYKKQGNLTTLYSAFFVHSLQSTIPFETSNFNLFAFDSQGKIINIPVEFISDTVSPLL